MKLYSFSKNAWHVRFFTWLFGQNPTRRYKTMCPYFWTYVLILLFLPLILIVKAFGKYGTQFLAWTKDYKHNRTQAAINHLTELCEDPALTPKDAHAIVNSKCYKKHDWDIEYDTKNRVTELANIHYDVIKAENRAKLLANRERKENFTKTYEEYKEYKWFNYLSYLISFGLIAFILISIGYAIYQGGKMIDWPFVGKWAVYITGVAIALAAAIGVVYCLVKYIIVPFFNWTSCVKLPTCGICDNIKGFFRFFLFLWIPFKYIFIGIYKFFAIIVNMIYSTYKKQCPMITWED
jgi:hypothetical protein